MYSSSREVVPLHYWRMTYIHQVKYPNLGAFPSNDNVYSYGSGVDNPSPQGHVNGIHKSFCIISKLQRIISNKWKHELFYAILSTPKQRRQLWITARMHWKSVIHIVLHRGNSRQWNHVCLVTFQTKQAITLLANVSVIARFDLINIRKDFLNFCVSTMI